MQVLYLFGVCFIPNGLFIKQVYWYRWLWNRGHQWWDTNDTQAPEEEVLPVIRFRVVLCSSIIRLMFSTMRRRVEMEYFSMPVWRGQRFSTLHHKWLVFEPFTSFDELTAIEVHKIDLQVNLPRGWCCHSLEWFIDDRCLFRERKSSLLQCDQWFGVYRWRNHVRNLVGDYLNLALWWRSKVGYHGLDISDPMSALSGNGFGGANLMGELVWDLT